MHYGNESWQNFLDHLLWVHSLS